MRLGLFALFLWGWGICLSAHSGQKAKVENISKRAAPGLSPVELMHELGTNLDSPDFLQQTAAKESQRVAEATDNMRRQEEKNRLLQEKQQQQEARLRIQYWLIAASVFAVVTVLITLLLLYRTNAKNKRTNAELEIQRQQLEELNKVKDKMLGIIAHDLRAPLASMHGMLYLLREGELSKDEINEMAAELDLAINQNLSMMDNLLVWAREQMSGLAMSIEVINAHNVVEGVLENFKFQAHHKGITLHNDVIPGMKVNADFNLLKLILRNLISNSIKFSREGDKITVSTRKEEGKVVFEVQDTGIGIPEETQKRLFSYNSGSRAGTKNEKGSGLGLRLCKEFVEKQNGEIKLESIEGEGTVFKFTLPHAS